MSQEYEHPPLPRYSFGISGIHHFLLPASEVQVEVVEPFFDTPEWQYDRAYFETIPALRQTRTVTALGGLDIVLIVTSFIGTCFAKKIFDDVYERTLKRPIGAQLDKLFAKIKIPDDKLVEIRDVIYLEDIDLSVIIRAFVNKNSPKEISAQIMQAHRLAHSYIEQHGKMGAIHCYTILNSQIQLTPSIFDSLTTIEKNDRKGLIGTHMTIKSHTRSE
jgi:hypothetical protein